MAIRDSQLTRIALELWADLERRTELPVQGISMWPVLRSGERIVVRHGGAPPRLGQVIVILHGERVLAHRVIQWRKQGVGRSESRRRGGRGRHEG
jgi:phage repressor protein C with HTH and peptisase S24 domain